jgi:signal-transduction protein with cAMP-binding, CBS, and nucleotidyltransferase domain
MYIIRKGSVAVVNHLGEIMSMLGVGDLFGEIALITGVSGEGASRGGARGEGEGGGAGPS